MQGLDPALTVQYLLVELGNALSIISGAMTPQDLEASDRSAPVPGSGFLNSVAGIKLLNCVQEKGGIK